MPIFHHASLLNSLILLFEKRLGGEVYRPIGMEWAEKGFWRVYDHPFTREQFLSTTLGVAEPPPQMYPDGTRPLNIVDKVENGIFYCQDIDSGYYNKAIEMDKFMMMPFDIVIASIPQHVEPFKRLCEIHPNKPKLIFQIGNAWTVEAGMAPNIMASAIINNIPPDINFISYHQEFDINIFKPDFDHKPDKNIFSFINCFNIEKFYEHDWELFKKIEKLMPDWNFKSYGGQCRDGARHGSVELAKGITESRFVWHTKFGGDGYGHIVHNVPAMGRPMIVKKEYYQGKMAEALLIDDDTCICIDNLTPEQIVTKINNYNEVSNYERLVKMSYQKFKEIVDFEKEETKIREFLSVLR